MADLRAVDPVLRSEIEAGIRAVMESGRFVLGAQVEAFEAEAAAYVGTDRAVTCASGTDALLLALMALDIGPGDEVITTTFSFFATVEAIVHAGARPVLVDVDADTFNLDPAQVEQAITAATRAVIPVHLFGQPAAMEPLREVTRRHGLWLVEDCAQAFGARRGDRRVGALGDAGCFSFFPSKNLGGYGDGGMVTTDSAALAQRLRRLRNHGSAGGGVHGEVGLNSRLDEIQAVVLRAKLKRIEWQNAARRRAARAYGERLAPLPGVTVPAEDPGGQHVYGQYTVCLDDRDRVRALLRKAGIATAVHYRLPLHRQPALDGYAGQPLPVAESLCERCLSLPMFPELGDARIEATARALASAVATPRRPATL